MPKFVKRSSKKAGSSPGTLIYVGKEKTHTSLMHLFSYSKSEIIEKVGKSIGTLKHYIDSGNVNWININAIHESSVIEAIGEMFHIHPLALEDIMNTAQRPKMEDYDDYIFLVVKMITFEDLKNELEIEQISIVLGDYYLLAFQEKEGDVFDPIRDRLRLGKGKILERKADYLAYALLDAVVDNYFTALEKIGEKIELLEDRILNDPKPETLEVIHTLKRELVYLRKSVWPLREIISGLQRSESKIIDQSTSVYLRDLYDHTIQAIDTIETYRDIISGMLDTYLTAVSNRMNEVMKVLTIIATIFIPLTFIAGVYGMNFHGMPELSWPWAYPLGFWSGIVIIGGFLVLYFKHKKWL
ncbi:magnesium/cobalt transporter CorA [bacterium]|nr:magnesium/cobalt transporter CorA [candidate division CSSED10-310 bacterium]